MTVKEAIKSFPGLSDITDNFLDKLILDRALNGSAEYAASLKGSAELVAADGYIFMLNSPDFSEGGLSITLKRSEMRATAIKLYKANGEGSKADQLEMGVGISRSNKW